MRIYVLIGKWEVWSLYLVDFREKQYADEWKLKSSCEPAFWGYVCQLQERTRNKEPRLWHVWCSALVCIIYVHYNVAVGVPPSHWVAGLRMNLPVVMCKDKKL